MLPSFYLFFLYRIEHIDASQGLRAKGTAVQSVSEHKIMNLNQLHRRREVTRLDLRAGGLPRAIASCLICLMALQASVPLAAGAQAVTSHRSKLPKLASHVSLADTPYSLPSRIPKLAPLGQQQTSTSNSARSGVKVAISGALPISSPPVSSLLDQVGVLARPVLPAQVSAWKHALTSTRLTPERQAQLHLWIGEWLLAHNQQPHAARWHFRAAQHLTSRLDRVAGLAAYDNAIAQFDEGNYEDATDAFRALLLPKTARTGYSRRNCALWLRHAGASEGDRAQRASLGIPEPPRLDPACGAAALAAGLKALGFPSDRKTVLVHCRVTGEGSTLQDLLDAGPKLGVNAQAVTADDKGLIALPKPLIGFVESDHFLAVTRADAKGVAFACADCGPWPGGQVNLTWRQWHALNPGLYVVLTRPGGAWERTLQAVLHPVQLRAASASVPPVRVASIGSLAGLGGAPHPSALRALLPAVLRLRGHVFLARATAFIQCGQKNASQSPNPDHNIPNDSPGKNGPGNDDPVNLATGEDTFHPAADLNVYNPHGPSVSWSRLYNSLRNVGQGYYGGDQAYEDADFGVGWSQDYNVGIYDPSGGTGFGTTPKYVFLADGSRIAFTAPAVPTAASPHVACTVEPGIPLLIEWDYDGPSGQCYYTVTSPDRSRWVTTALNSDTLCCVLAQIYSRTGQAVDFHYGPPSLGTQWPLLASVADHGTGTTLLTIQRATDGTGNVVAVEDCYGRAVYYHVGYYANSNVPTPWPRSYQQLDRVSQIVPACTPNPADRDRYGYQGVTNGDAGTGGGERVNFLHTASIPSPTGSGWSTATINYDPSTECVTSVVDGNGITSSYTFLDASGNPTPVPSNYTRVTVTDLQGNVVHAHTVGYDRNFNQTSDTDGRGVVVSTIVYANPNSPNKPSSVADAAGRTTRMTWDAYGNPLTSTSPRGTVVTSTWDYSQFALGEMKQTQVSCPSGSLPATVYAYYEPTGLPQSVTGPAASGSGVSRVTSSFTYNQYGDVLTSSGPGNDAAQTITASFDYGSSPAVGEPLTVTDNLGKSSHLTYTPMGLVQSTTDAIGNQSSVVYNIANQAIQAVSPATGQTGPGQSFTINSYLYTGGLLMATSAYDESGQVVRQVNFRYGQEGETLGTTGSVPASSFVYDALYRTVARTDGNGNATHYYWNQAGYLNAVTYPGYAGGAPAFDAGSGTWTGISGPDSVRYTLYGSDGTLRQTVDGNNAETDYGYADPAGALTDVQHPASPSLNVHYGYGDYGRLADKTDGTGAQSYDYGDSGELKQVRTTYTGLPTQALSYAYYPDGSRKTMTTPGGAFAYHYDGNGRLVGLVNPFNETSQWGYQDNGWLQTQQSAQVATGYAHNALGELTGLTNSTVGGSPLSSYTQMAYDAVGERASVTASVPGLAAASGQTQYAYDGLGRLTGEQSARNGGYSLAFGCDGAGNLATVRSQTHSFNADNQDTSNAYDGNGNPTTYQGTTLAFNANDRATAIGSALTCGYTGSGQRAWKLPAGGSKAYFLYDGTSSVCEMDGTGAVTAVNTWGAGGLISGNATAIVF